MAAKPKATEAPEASVAPVPEPASDKIHVTVRVLGNDSRCRAGIRWAAGQPTEADVTLEQLDALDADAMLDVKYNGKKPKPLPLDPSIDNDPQRIIAGLHQRLHDEAMRHAAMLTTVRQDAQLQISRLRDEYVTRIAELERDVEVLKGQERSAYSVMPRPATSDERRAVND